MVFGHGGFLLRKYIFVLRAVERFLEETKVEAKANIDEPERNPDPLTNEPGAHPIGAGVGAATGGVAGIGAAAVAGAALGTAVGPVGATLGAVVGAVAGGLAGKEIAEQIDPAVDEADGDERTTTCD